MLQQSGNTKAALEKYEALLAVEPSSDAYANYGVALRTLGHIQAAIVVYRQALHINPKNVAALSNLGGGLRALGQLDEAFPVLQQAIQLQPDFIGAHYNLGLVYMDNQQPEQAIVCFDTVLNQDPNRVDAQFDRATCLLQLGKLKEGFEAYECRFGYEPRLVKPYSQPKWDGNSLNGRTLLLYAEQGFGDTLQFIRYVSMIDKANGRIILECPPPLKRLMASVSQIDEVIVPGETLPPFDVHTSLLSLPHHFQTTLETIPAAIPYLQAPFYRLGVPQRSGAHLKVGLVWASGHSDVGVRNRTIPLETFLPLFELPQISFISLQKGPQAKQIKQIGLEGLVSEIGHRINDFADTAAVLEELDLLITADTAIVHLAGAMGKPCWVLLPYGSEWRWMLNQQDTPWYPSIRLFRRQANQTWTDVIHIILTALDV